MDPRGIASAGATAGGTEIVKSALVEAYEGLKSLTRRAFGGNEQANAAPTMYEGKPTERAFVEALTEHLAAIAADAQISAAAQRVLHLAGPGALDPGSVAATVLQIHAETGGIAAGMIRGPVTVNNPGLPAEPGRGAGPGPR